MAYLLVLLITAFNCVGLFFSSLLAVGSEGRADGVLKIWLVGFSWIAVFALVAMIECARGKRTKALTIASSALPAGYATFLVGILVVNYYSQLRPNAPALEAACASAGPRYPAARHQSL